MKFKTNIKHDFLFLFLSFFLVLLSIDHQGKAAVAFQKYIDSLLDLLLLPGMNKKNRNKNE